MKKKVTSNKKIEENEVIQDNLQEKENNGNAGSSNQVKNDKCRVLKNKWRVLGITLGVIAAVGFIVLATYLIV